MRVVIEVEVEERPDDRSAMEYETDSSNASFTYDDWNITEGMHPLRMSASVTVVVLSVFGVIGNLCLMYAILRHKHMRTAPNILIFNLAVADLLYIVITSPIYVKHELIPMSELSLGACKVVHCVAFLAQYVSAFALAALSRERYTAIVGGIEARQRGTDSCASSNRGVVATVWLASFLLTIPTLVFAHKRNGYQCTYAPKDPITNKVYDCLRFAVGYVIPLAIVSFFYVKIAVSLVRSSKRFQNEYVTDAMAYQTQVRKRLAVALLVITVFFAVCWFPYFFYYMLLSFGHSEDISYLVVDFPSATDIYRYIGLLTPIVNTCLDPWLLFVISSRHRACLSRCLRYHRPDTSGQSVRMTTFRRHRFSAGTGTSISRLSRV